jgi:RNA polymerase sigma-70 factor (sigma-B/F/G subfamily)
LKDEHMISDFKPAYADGILPAEDDGDTFASASSSRSTRTHELLSQAATADEETAARLREEAVLLNIEVAESLAMRYRGRGVPDEDLIQTAHLGLVKAVRGFDADRSDNFLGFAVPTMLGEIKRYFRDHAWTIKPPRRIQELQPQVWSASARLAGSAGETPANADVARELGVKTSDVDEALAARQCFSASSLDYQVSGSRDGDDVGAALIDILGDEDPGFERAEAMVALRPLCRNLSERDRRLIYLRYFHEWTQARIAEEFGVTQMQISRLLSRVLRQLRDDMSLLGEADQVTSRPAIAATA